MVQAAPRFQHYLLCCCRHLQLIQRHVTPSHGPPTISPLFFQGKSLLLPKPLGKREQSKAVVPTYSAKAAWSSLVWLPHLGFKSPRQSSSAAPFPTPPTVGYTGLHSYILPALLGCHSKSGQVWPHGMEPIISKISLRCCNQGALPPSYILGGSHFHPPGSEHGHRYLTYL